MHYVLPRATASLMRSRCGGWWIAWNNCARNVSAPCTEARSELLPRFAKALRQQAERTQGADAPGEPFYMIASLRWTPVAGPNWTGRPSAA